MRMPQTLVLENVAPATRLLEKRRQMFEVQETLDAQKEEFARREEAFRRREEGLRQKDLELQDSLIRFNKFLQENESKHSRAVKRAAEEARQRKIKEAEILDLQQQLVEAQEEQRRLQLKVQRNQKYERYLVDVQERNTDEFGEVSELKNRYTTLKSAYNEGRTTQRITEERNESERAEFLEFTKTATNEILNFNNQIASKQKQLEIAEKNAQQAQYAWEKSIEGAARQTLMTGKVLMAVENLLQRCTAKHGQRLKHTLNETKFAEGDDGAEEHLAKIKDKELKEKGASAIQHLEIIKNYMKDFAAITEAYKKQKKAEEADRSKKK